MAYFHPVAVEHRRKLYTRQDAWRLAPPGTPEAKMPGWLDPSATRVRLKEAQEEEARAQAEAAQEEFERELLELRWEVKKLKLDHELWLLEEKYSPNQPRDERGRWTDAGGASQRDATDSSAESESERQVLSDETPDPVRPGAQYAQGDRLQGYPVDLREEQRLGGHAIEGHVGKSDEFLLTRVRTDAAKIIERGEDFRGLSVGSFSSLESATRLVNSTIAQNQQRVEEVVRGDEKDAFFTARFSSSTGREAYLQTFHTEPYMRETYGVGVFILRDPQASKGWRVQSAYPIR